MIAEPPASYSEADLNSLTKAQIQALAEECGYQLSGTTKAALIASFLTAQG